MVDRRDVPGAVTLPGLVPWAVPLLPVALVLAGGWALTRLVAVRGTSAARRGAAWAARVVLVLVFLAGLAALVADVLGIYAAVGDGRYVL